MNPQYLDAVKMGRWSRNIPKKLYFFEEKEGSIYIPKGYLYELKKMKGGIRDNRRLFEDIEFHFSGTPKDFQSKAIKKALKEDMGVIQAPTGSGKTVMALAIVAERKQPTIIIVHTKDLMEQWKNRIETFLGVPKNKVGAIGGGGNQFIGEHITIAMVQTLYNIAPAVYKHFSHVIVDECHRVPSRTFTEALIHFDATYYLGLSATPYRRDGLTKLINWYMGPTVYEVKNSNMIKKKAILPIIVFHRRTKFKTKFNSVWQYPQMIKELTEDKKRNEMLVKDALRVSKKGTVLLLSDRKEHLTKLYDEIVKKEKRIALLTGSQNIATRNKEIARINKGEVKIVLATGQLIGEGFDCKELCNLILSTPIKFSGRLLQYLGRVLRPMKGKKIAKIYDYIDVNIDTLVRSSGERDRIYKKEFNITFKE